MKKAVGICSVMAAFCLLLSSSLSCLAAEAYTYTVTISAGNWGTLNVVDGVSISVDGDGGYEISLEDGGKTVKITGLTSSNHVRFLNSAVSVTEGSKYYVKGIRMGGRDNSQTLAYFPVERDQDYVVAYGIQGDMVQYTVNCVDAAGNQLYPPQVYYGNVGDKPVLAYLYVEGYQPQAYNLTRTLQSDASKNVFTFVYTPVQTVVPETDGGTGGGRAPEGGAQEPGTTVGGTGGDAGVPGGAGAPEPGEGGTPPEELGDTGTPLDGDAPEPETPDEPDDLVDLDDEETPLAGNVPGNDGTVAEANDRMWKYTWIAAGIGLLAVIALAAGAYLYRKMHAS